MSTNKNAPLQITHNELKERIPHGTSMFPLQHYHHTLLNIYPHWHNHFEIVFVEKGELTLNVNLSEYHIHSNDIFVITPGLLHSGLTLYNTPMIINTLILDLDFLESHGLDINEIQYILPLLNGDVKFPVILSPINELYNEVKNTFFEIVMYINKTKYGYELMIKSLLYKLLAIYFMNFTQTIQESKKDRITVEKIKTIVNYVNTHITSHITLRQVAEELGFTPSYFCRFFKASTGLTFVEYLNHHRINNAIALLINSSMSITEIAYEVGFEDLSYFIKVFKKEKIYSPTSYRKKFQHDL